MPSMLAREIARVPFSYFYYHNLSYAVFKLFNGILLFRFPMSPVLFQVCVLSLWYIRRAWGKGATFEVESRSDLPDFKSSV